SAEPGLAKVFSEIELPLLPVLARMERLGTTIELFAVMMAFAFSVPCAGRFQRPFAVKLRRFFCHAANG
ncbi:hypothetical protein ACSZNQ_20190, partial [Aeromonas hydrophila]